MTRPALTRRAALALVGAAAVAAPGRAAAELAPIPRDVAVFESRTGRRFALAALLRGLRLAKPNLAVFGEIHDNLGHHAIQAAMVRAYDPQGLAFEMIRQADEAAVNAFREATPDADVAALAPLGERLGWAKSGWPAWPNYARILAAAPAAHVTGGALARARLMAAMRQGPGVDPTAARFGLDQPLAPDEQARRVQGQVAAHCDLIPESAAPGMVSVQRVRDASFADALLRAAAEGGGRAALITGNGHARADWGVPALIRRAAPKKTILTFGLLEAEPGQEPRAARLETIAKEYGGDRPPFDYLVITQRRKRPDPCIALRERFAPKKTP